MPLLPSIQISHPGPMPPSTPHSTDSQTSPMAPNHKSQSNKFTITNHNTLKDKLSNSLTPTPIPTDKVKIWANINKVIK